MNPQSSQQTQPTNTLKRPLPPDDERPTSKRQKREEAGEGMEVDSSFTATNHDRQENQPQSKQAQTDASVQEKEASQDALGIAKADLDPIFKDVG